MQKTRMWAASAVVACGFAATAASASASYMLDPPGTAYTGTATTNQTFKMGSSGPTFTCVTSSFTGATGSTTSSSTSFLAAYSGTGSGGSCNAGVLGNVSVTISGNWNLTVTGGGPTVYTGYLSIPSGSSVTLRPLTFPTCTITLTSAGNSALSGFSGVNASPTGTRIYGTVVGIQYTVSSGCVYFASGTRADMTYNTGGTASSGGISTPGITFAGP